MSGLYVCVCVFFDYSVWQGHGQKSPGMGQLMESIMPLHLFVDSGDWTQVTGFAQQCLYSLDLSQPRSHLAAGGLCALQRWKTLSKFLQGSAHLEVGPEVDRVEASGKEGQWRQGGGGQGTGSIPTMSVPLSEELV